MPDSPRAHARVRRSPAGCPRPARRRIGPFISPSPTRQARAGLTLVELCITLSIAAVLMAIAIPRAALSADRATAHAALQRLAAAYALARASAAAQGTPAVATLDSANRTITVTLANDTLLSAAPLGDRPLTLSATRLAITFGPTGLGFGAANTRVIARVGRAADTLVTSRLGRVRY